jgi:hypothetical protein
MIIVTQRYYVGLSQKASISVGLLKEFPHAGENVADRFRWEKITWNEVEEY